MVSMVHFGGTKMTLESANVVRQHRQKFNLSLGLGMGLDLDLDLDDKAGREAIHSGHFMVSEIDDPDVQEEDSSALTVHETDDTQDVVLPPNNDELSLGINSPEMEGACSNEPNQYPFGVVKPFQTVSIDASLTKLLECMTLVYSGKLTSPRWKTFKGVKMRLKEKIRLNNIIWRAWHLQFVAKQSPFVCQFASPLEGEPRNKPEAVVLEGKYLKRGMKTVIAEYKKCRMFYRDRARCIQTQDSSSVAMDLDYRWPSLSNSSLTSALDDELFMDFSDTLFGTLIPNEPFDFPNPREIARAGIADFIQPGLVQLQPALDDFMDTFEPLQDILNARFLPTLPEEGPLPESQSRAHIPSFEPRTSSSSHVTVAPLPSLLTPPPSNLSYHSNSSSPFLQTALSSESSSSSSINKLENAQQQAYKPTSLHNNPFLIGSFSNLNTEPLNTVAPILGDRDVRNFLPRESDVGFQGQDDLTPEMGETQPLAPTSASLLPSQSVVPHQATASVFALKANKSKPPTYSSPISRRHTVPNVPMRSIIQPKGAKQASVASTSLLKPPKLIALNNSNDNNSAATLNRNFASNNNQSMDSGNPNTPKLLTLNQTPFQSPSHSAAAAPITNQLAPRFQANSAASQSKVLEQPTVFSFAALQTSPGGGGANKTKRTPTRAEIVNYRRHSLAGQPPSSNLEPIQIKAASGNAITGANSQQKDAQFAVPKTKTRSRSRSISSPQNGNNQSVKNITPKPTQAISLTNISISPPMGGQSILPAPSGFSSGQQMPPLLPAPAPMRRTAAAANTGMMPTNRLLAQFISPGVSFQRSEGTTLVSSTSTSPTVTIISSVSSSSPSVPQTLVLSPVTLTTVPGSDLSRGLLMGTSGNMFSGTLETQKMSLPGSPGSSTVISKNNYCYTLVTQQQEISDLPPNSPPPAQNNTTDANSPQPKAFRPKSDVERIQYKEHKRVCHINAEQKRRCNIKHGFEAIHQLVPSLCHNPNSKISKAAMLQKAVDYIRTLKAERNQQLEESESLKKQIDQLNQTINNYQNQLPASGAPVPSQRTNHMRERFDEYVKASALRNWKFWIFSLLLEPLLESFSSTVSTASVEELCKTTITWLNQHCSLASLRPVVLNSLRHLSTSTNILTDPSRLPEEATRAVTKKEKSSK